MKYELINIDEIQINKRNPRVLKKEKYKKLYDSVLVFPKMLEVRPIVVDENNCILGGNMRYLVLRDISQQDFISLHNRLNELITFLEKSEEEKQSILNFWKNFLENKKIKVLRAKFSEVESKEFIIKDNLSYGDWDYEILIDEWSIESLAEWGIENVDLDIDEIIEVNEKVNFIVVFENLKELEMFKNKFKIKANKAKYEQIKHIFKDEASSINRVE